MNNLYKNELLSNVTCRFSSMVDCAADDDRISLNIPNTCLHVNFVITEKIDDKMIVKILKNNMLQELLISSDSLMEHALRNTQKKEKACFKNFREVIGIDLTKDVQNVIVTNESLYYGAIAILYDGVIERVKNQIGDFYIIPASVHEVICVPKIGFDKKDLLYSVYEINRGPHITRYDILADDIFEIVDGKLQTAFLNYM